MSDTYEAFYNGKPLNPNRGLPTMSYAQAEDCGLTDSERLWCRTDGDGTVITADEVPYDSNNSVKDKIDSTNESINALNTKVGSVYIKTISNQANVIKFTTLDYNDNKQFLTLQGFDSNGTPVNCVIQYAYSSQSGVSNPVSSDGRNVTTSGNTLFIPVTAWSRFMVISPYNFAISSS